MDSSDKAVAVDTRPEDDAPDSGVTGSRGRRRLLVGGAVVLVVGAAVAVKSLTGGTDYPPSHPPHADSSVAGTPVTVGVDVCGAGWDGGKAGTQSFAVWNNSIQGMEVYLEDTATKKVYLDVENLGAGVTRNARVVLGPGRYEFVCLPTEEQPLHGRPRSVTGAAPAGVTPGIVPITRNDLLPVVAQYEGWIKRQLPLLQRQTVRLGDDVRRGDLAAAKRDWLSAHLRYETLGAAYGAFGDHDTEINGLPAPGRAPATDPQLVGFHKIEALLWSGAPAGRIAPYTTKLTAAVASLRRGLTGNQDIDALDMGLRSHEILENTIQFVLTGRDDAGSQTGLATVEANLEGTLQAMKPLRGLLRSRDPDLAATDQWIARSQRLVRSYDHGGRWTPLAQLDQSQREVLDASLTKTVELLSEIAVITDPRRGAE